MTEHIVKSYDEELNRMTNAILQMGGLVEAQLAAAIQALVKRDSELARKTIDDDAKVDDLEQDIDQLATRLLALRQPMAVDLRAITAALKLSGDLERIGDYAANVAKRAITLNQIEPVKPLTAIPRMAEITQAMIKDVLDSYVERNVDKAIAVWRRDQEVDDMYNALFRELLTYMMEDPRHITPCTHLLFIAKNIERSADHITNVAETINFLVNGTRLIGERPKHDTTPFTALSAETRAPASDPGDDGTGG